MVLRGGLQPDREAVRQQQIEAGGVGHDAAGGGDHGKAETSGVGGFQIKGIASQNTVFRAAMSKIAELGQRVTPAVSFLGPYFEVPFLTASENSSLA